MADSIPHGPRLQASRTSSGFPSDCSCDTPAQDTVLEISVCWPQSIKPGHWSPETWTPCIGPMSTKRPWCGFWYLKGAEPLGGLKPTCLSGGGSLIGFFHRVHAYDAH